jgi:hypothetical protein
MSATYEVVSPAPLYVETQSAAVVLCKTSGEPCTAENRYASGTAFSAALQAGTSLVVEDSEGRSLDSCTSSSLAGQVTNPGGPEAEKATIGLTSTTLKSCAVPTTLETAPSLIEIRKGIPGNGVGTIGTIKVRMNTILFGTCIYSGSPTISITGGNPGWVVLKGAILERVSGICSPTAKVSATYQVSSPNPLYVAAP